MAGKLTVNPVQINDSATATNNFVLKADNAGGVKLSRGNDGATTQDILSVASDGKVTLTNNIVPAFAVDKTTNQALSSGAVTLVTWQTELFDTNNNFASNRFTPTVAGYYQINCSLRCQATNMTNSALSIRKNGALYINGTNNAFTTTSVSITHSVSSIVYLNGSTDYVEIYGAVVGTSPIFEYGADGGNGFSGCLVRAA